MRPTFNILTFGCQMNVRDSQWLASALHAQGYEACDAERADVVILNTCSVRAKPERKVAEAIRRLERGGSRLFCVTGCVAQQQGEKLFAISPAVRLIAGTDAIGLIPASLAHLLANPKERAAYLDFSAAYVEKAPDAQSGASAFVNIMQGCDNFCSYCIVPFTRGRQKYRGAGEILEECRQRLESGALEITLLGQNVNAWGKGGAQGFAWLLEQVSRLAGLVRLRYITPHPRDMDMESVQAFKTIANLCPRLHLPMQSGSDNILKKMRRGYDSDQFLALVERLKAARPDLALSTDIIVGFPGETEQDFLATLQMLRACGFASSFSFCYSDRPGTRASLMPDKIPEEVKLERLGRLQELQEELTRRWLRARVGARTEVLIEKRSSRSDFAWQGRDPYGAIVNVAAPGGGAVPGRIIPVEITAAKRHTLTGRVL